MVAKQTGSDYRAKNRARLQKFYKRQAASGRKRISALISGDIYELLIKEKIETGATISEIIEQAVARQYRPRKPTPSSEKTPKKKAPDPETPQPVADTPATGIITPSQMDLFQKDGTDLIPDLTDRDLTIQERDSILIQVADAMPGRQYAKDRVTLLNQKGIPVIAKAGMHSGRWDRKKFSDNLRLARKRLEKNSVIQQ